MKKFGTVLFSLAPFAAIASLSSERNALSKLSALTVGLWGTFFCMSKDERKLFLRSKRKSGAAFPRLPIHGDQCRWGHRPLHYCAAAATTALMKAEPLGVPNPVTLSQPGPVIRDESVPKVNTSQRVEAGL